MEFRRVHFRSRLSSNLPLRPYRTISPLWRLMSHVLQILTTGSCPIAGKRIIGGGKIPCDKTVSIPTGLANEYCLYFALYHSDILPLRSTAMRSEEHTTELQSLMRISYAVF